MRYLPFVVVVESVVVIVLGSIWLFGQDARPLGAGGVGERAGMAGVDARTASVDRGDPGSVAAGTVPARREVAGGWDPSVGVVVRGTVMTSDGSEPPSEPLIGFRRSGEFRSSTVVGDRYAVAALEPGEWDVSVRADGFARFREICELGDEPVQTFDIVLEPAQVVRVFVRTPDGEPFRAAAGGPRLPFRFHVVATDVPLVDDLFPTDNASVGDLGIARYRSASRIGARLKPDEPDGELWLDRPPPAHAALLLRHVVLARQPIAVGQTELSFVVTTEDVNAKFSTVSLRLVDGVTGLPVTEDAFVRLATAQGGGSGGRPDADGRVVVERVLPGLAALSVNSGQDREGIWDLVRVPVGGTVELGEVILHPRVVMKGRLVDGAGAPVPGSVQWTDLATMDFPRELVDRRSASADGDGEVEIWGAGPRRYVVIARDREGRVGHTVVDARGGFPPPFEIRMLPAAKVVVTVVGGAFESFVVTIRDADGVPIAARTIEPRFPSGTVTVPSGEYTVEVHGAGDRLVKRTEVEARAGASVSVEVR